MGGEGELDLVTTGGAEGKTGRYYSSGRMSPVLYVCVDIPLDQSARGEAKGKGQASMRGSNALRSELCQVSFCRSVAFFGGQRQVGQAGCSSRGNAGDVGQNGAYQRRGSRGWMRVTMSSLMLRCSRMARQVPRAPAPACARWRGHSQDEDEAGRRSKAPRVHGRCGVARADAAKDTLQRLLERGT
jgi:hypothetical protein